MQFKMEDVTFFEEHTWAATAAATEGPRPAILAMASVTLKLNNQKNVWKYMCLNFEANAELYN